MQAVFKTGGKQYRVSKGDKLRIESLKAEAGDAVEFDQVLMLVDGDKSKIGEPVVKGSKVKAKVLENGRGKKVHILKFRRRKHHMKQQGHRQNYTEVEITGITGGKAASKKAATKKTASKKAASKKTASKKTASKSE